MNNDFGSTPSTELPSRRERQKAETRELLYRAALSVFSERGLSASTVEEITKAAGVAKGTFFNHFRTKEEVFRVFIEIQLANVAAAVEELGSARRDARTVLRGLFHRIAGEFGNSATLTGALLSALFGSEPVREIMAQGMASGRQRLAAIVASGQKSAEIRADRKPEAMALAFQQALFGILSVWAVQRKGKLSSWLDASFENFWAGIAPQTGRNSL
jgi:AcrR family transcriptional regulator